MGQKGFKTGYYICLLVDTIIFGSAIHDKIYNLNGYSAYEVTQPLAHTHYLIFIENLKAVISFKQVSGLTQGHIVVLQVICIPRTSNQIF